MPETLWNSQRILLTACGLLAAYWLIQLCLQTHVAPKQSDALLLQQRHTSSSDNTGNGVHQVVEGVSLVYEAPAAPKGVLLLFHGCQHSSTDWWMQSPHCPECTGLPEEVKITQDAVQFGYAAIALSSQMRQHPRCWDTSWPPTPGSDFPMVEKAVRSQIEQHGWADLPVYALGASSGGAFALLLALQMPLQGVCCQIMSLPTSALSVQPNHTGEAGSTYPPTVFAHMVRDERTAQGVAENAAVLQDQEILHAVQGTPVLELPVHPQPLTAAFLSNRTPQISPALSTAIHSTLRNADMLDAEGFLKQDPRRTASVWQSLLRQQVPATRSMNLQHDESAIHEELNLAWAGHELIADVLGGTLRFFEERQ